MSPFFSRRDVTKMLQDRYISTIDNKQKIYTFCVQLLNTVRPARGRIALMPTTAVALNLTSVRGAVACGGHLPERAGVFFVGAS